MSYDVDTLIKNHLNVARDIAIKEWKTAPHALRQDELIALANLGLVDAANRWEAYCEKKQYDPEAVQYFKVFAGLRIRGTIRDQIRKDDWATRTLRTKSKKLRDAGQDEGLTIEQLAEKTGMGVTEIHKVNTRMSQRPVSLDYLHSRVDDDKDYSDRGVEIKNDVDTESESFAKLMLSTFVDSVRKLPSTEQLIIVLHYYSKLSLEDISTQLQMSEAKIIQLHKNAVLTIRDTLVFNAQERD